MNRRHVHFKLSQTLALLHNEQGFGAVLNETGEPISADAIEGDEYVQLIDGPRLRPKKDIRRFMFKVPAEIKERSGTVVWSGYDELADVSCIGTARIIPESGAS